ncbi:MAG: von Willebrand factor type A domain-containing protein [Microscillaceae bacterium]|jgi:Ca-activated chloride channel family protein|nr:von Willebrand factor type A domain-containing protein [Microscillaceae bacterium]
MKKKLLFLIISLIISHLAYSQARQITGKVTDTDSGEGFAGVSVFVKGSTNGTVTNSEGKYSIWAETGNILVFQAVGVISQEIVVAQQTVINVALKVDSKNLSEVVVTGVGKQGKRKLKGENLPPPPPIRIKNRQQSQPIENQIVTLKSTGKDRDRRRNEQEKNDPEPENSTESYNVIEENEFLAVKKNPLSTFSIDVDNAAYTNIRRFINNGQKPPKDAVRIEEMVNYFQYDYPQPTDNQPFSINTEVSTAPWNPQHKLMLIGLQGKKIAMENLPASNLTFLLDVSGSMSDENKLPLLKQAFKLLIKQLRPQDRVAIVVYAGAAGLVLPPTSGREKDKIIAALENLEAGGSTAGGEGIILAYQIAQQNFIENGNNRVILATDGDFNVGASSDAEMVRLIEDKRQTGVFLTCLGLGMGNYKDSKLESLANKGNGNYAYIDNIQEANKVFVKEFGGTLFTIAKDVKLQLEFNPTKVKAYRLIGYENRVLADEDFNDDKKDAGELGAGHTVTALYEIIPTEVESPEVRKVDDLKYQTTTIKKDAYTSQDLLTVKFRYKAPQGSESQLIEHTLLDKSTKLEQTSDNFRFAAAVAGFGMLLRDSKFKGNLNYEKVVDLAQNAKGKDEEGYRAEFIRLVRTIQ